MEEVFNIINCLDSSFYFVFWDLSSLRVNKLEDLYEALKYKYNDTKFQIPAFLIASKNKSLEDFLKLRENKEAMKFVYELYFKIYGDINIFEEFFGKYFLGLLKNCQNKLSIQCLMRTTLIWGVSLIVA